MAGAVFCDGVKNMFNKKKNVHFCWQARGILAFFDVLKCVFFMLFLSFIVVHGCAYFFFIERHVYFVWQAQCFAMVEKVTVSFLLAGARDFCVC